MTTPTGKEFGMTAGGLDQEKLDFVVADLSEQGFPEDEIREAIHRNKSELRWKPKAQKQAGWFSRKTWGRLPETFGDIMGETAERKIARSEMIHEGTAKLVDDFKDIQGEAGKPIVPGSYVRVNRDPLGSMEGIRDAADTMFGPTYGQKEETGPPEELPAAASDAQWRPPPIDSDVGLVRTVGRAQKRGVYRLFGMTTGTVFDITGQVSDSEGMREFGRLMKDYSGQLIALNPPTPHLEDKNVWDNPEMLLDPYYWADSSEMIPGVLAMIASGGAGAKMVQVAGAKIGLSPSVLLKLTQWGAALSAGTAGGVQEGAGTYDQMIAEGASEKGARRAAIGFGFASAGLNALGYQMIFGGPKAQQFVKHALLSGGWESGTEAAEEPTEALIMSWMLDMSGQEILGEIYESRKAAATVLGPAFLTGAGMSTLSSTSDSDADAPLTPKERHQLFDLLMKSAAEENAIADIRDDPNVKPVPGVPTQSVTYVEEMPTGPSKSNVEQIKSRAEGRKLAEDAFKETLAGLETDSLQYQIGRLKAQVSRGGAHAGRAYPLLDMAEAELAMREQAASPEGRRSSWVSARTRMWQQTAENARTEITGNNRIIQTIKTGIERTEQETGWNTKRPMQLAKDKAHIENFEKANKQLETKLKKIDARIDRLKNPPPPPKPTAKERAAEKGLELVEGGKSETKQTEPIVTPSPTEKRTTPPAKPQKPPTSAETTVEPWQMTREEWVRKNAKDAKQAKKILENKVAGAGNVLHRHEESVRLAVAEGKPVSEATLKAYPHLTKKPDAPAPAPPKLTPGEKSRGKAASFPSPTLLPESGLKLVDKQDVSSYGGQMMAFHYEDGDAVIIKQTVIDDEPEVYIHAVEVKSKGRGTGTAMVNALLDVIKANYPEVKTVTLYAASDRAEAFWKRLGFRRDPSQPHEQLVGTGPRMLLNIETAPQGASTIEELDRQEGIKPAESLQFASEPALESLDHEARIWRFRTALIEYDDIIAERDMFQPRGQDRAASAAWVEEKGRELDPRALTMNQDVGQGIPTIEESGQIVAGFHRHAAIGRAITGYSERYEAYRKHLGGMGYDVESFEQPVLVRIPDWGQDRLELSRVSNVDPTQGYSAVEQARLDAENITWDMIQSLQIDSGNLSDNLMAARNINAVIGIIDAMATTDRGQFMTAQGGLSAEGLNRIIKAIFSKMYGGRLSDAFIDNRDEQIRNVRTALENSLADMASIVAMIESGGLPNSIDVTADIVAVTTKMHHLAVSSEKVSDYLAQGSIFADELTAFQKQMLQDFDARRRSHQKITAMLRDYVDLVRKNVTPEGQGEIFAQESTKEAVWRAATTQEDMFGDPVSTGLVADMGGYAKFNTVLELPEIVELAQQLSEGKYPAILKKMRKGQENVLGYFNPRNGKIYLNKDIFKDPELAAKVIAHEIGHVIDWLSEKNLARGNILGRLASLKKNLKSDVSEIIGTNKEIRQELIDLGQLWKPFDRSRNKKFTKYRESSAELYADAISIWFNDPKLFKQRAPKFTAALYDLLYKKPMVKGIYDEMQERLQSGQVFQRRDERLDEGMHGRGQQALIARMRAKKKGGLGEVRRQAVQSLIEQYESVYRYEKKARKQGKLKPSIVRVGDRVGVYNPEGDLPHHALERMIYQASEVDNYINLYAETLKHLKRHGLSGKIIDKVAFLERVIHERTDIANPWGYTLPTARDHLDGIREEVGEQKWAVVQAELTRFRDGRMALIIPAIEKSEMAADAAMDKIKNNPYYVTFDVFEKHVGEMWSPDQAGPQIYAQHGTLQEIAPTIPATILKDISLLWAARRTTFQLKTLEFVDEHFPTDEEGNPSIEDAPVVRGSKGQQIVKRPPPNSGKGLVQYIHKGELKSIWAPINLADEMNYFPERLHLAFEVLRQMGNVARTTLVEIVPGFAAVNFVRDFRAFMINMPGMNVATAPPKTVYWYLKALPDTTLHSLGLKREFIDMMKSKGGLITQASHRSSMNPTDEVIMSTMSRHDRTIWGVELNPVRNWIRKAFDILRWQGQFTELLPKVAGAKMLLKNKERLGLSDEQLWSHVRWDAGSPAFLIGPRDRGLVNAILIFFNPQVQGTRASVNALKRNPVDFMVKTAVYDLLPRVWMMAALMGWLGEKRKKMMEDVSSYDLTNYTIHSLGTVGEGRHERTVYLRVPHSETGRMLSGIFWNIMNNMVRGEGDLNGYLETVNYMGGQLPSLNPMLGAMLDATTYFWADQNPYDKYHERNVIPKRIFEEGGWESHRAFLLHLWDSMGGKAAYQFDSDGIDEIKTTLEEVLGMPVVGDVVGRFIKVSNYGQIEEMQTEIDKARQRPLSASNQREQEFKTFVNLNDTITQGDIVRLWKDHQKSGLAKDELGIPISIKRYRERIAYYMERREHDPYMQMLNNNSGRTETAAILRVAERKFTPEEYKQFVRDALQRGVLSQEALQYHELYKQGGAQ